MVADTEAEAPPPKLPFSPNLTNLPTNHIQSTLRNILNSIITSNCINHIYYINPQIETLRTLEFQIRNSPYLLQIGPIPLEELLCRSRSSIQDQHRAKIWPEEEVWVRCSRTFMVFVRPNGDVSSWTTTADMTREEKWPNRHRRRALLVAGRPS